jgi:threonine dehydratase
VSDYPTLADIAAARLLVSPYVRQTPCVTLCPGELTDAGLDCELVFKLELLQITGTFKPRGALSVMLMLSPEERSRGVTAVSAGNHAIAVAYAARAIGMSAKIVVSKSINPARLQRARAYGAEIELAADGAAAFARAKEIEAGEGRTFVHPFEGPRTVAGTGTLGVEWLEQAANLDAVVVAVGGGGLIAGVAAAIKQAAPSTKVFGVEPEGADSMSRSLAEGRPVTLSSVSTIADSLSPPMATPYTYGVCRRFVDSIALVSDLQMRRTMALMYADLKLCVEPAGAAALAGAIGPLRAALAGLRRVGIVVCGSNIDLQSFAALASV